MPIASRHAATRLLASLALVVVGASLLSCGGGGTADTVPVTPPEVPPVAPLIPETALPGIYVLAGSVGGHGNIDLNGRAARLTLPLGVTADSNGDLYVTQDEQCAIRKISPDGNVSSFTQQRSCPGVFAFRSAVDAGGNIYATSFDGFFTVYKFTSAGSYSKLVTGPALSNVTFLGRGSSTLPWGVAVDAGGNVYVANDQDNKIQKIDISGTVTTVAGGSATGAADGPGSAATFLRPSGLVRDSAGNLYVADTGNNTIRKITPAGFVSTVAGSAASGAGSNDGTGAAARFNAPQGVAVDAAGTLYVADTGNHTVRKITPDGVVTTIAGVAGQPGDADGVGTQAHFKFPEDVTLDKAGTLFVADHHNGTIRQITAQGEVRTMAGQALRLGFRDGAGQAAEFNQPQGLVADVKGNLYVADTLNHSIRKVDRAGNVTLLAGNPDAVGSTDGPAGVALFGYPMAIAMDEAGNLYVADSYMPAGSNLPTSPTREPNRSSPSLLRKITPEGTVSTLARGSSDLFAGSAGVLRPNSLASDLRGTLYLVDGINLKKITPDEAVTTVEIAGTGSFQPSTVAADAKGAVYVSGVRTLPDSSRRFEVVQIAPGGQMTTLANEDANSVACLGGSVIGREDGALYSAGGVSGGCIGRIRPNGSSVLVAGSVGFSQSIGTVLGPLPGSLDHIAQIVFIAPNRIAAVTPGAVIVIALPSS